MAKYNYELKIKVVEAYISGKGGFSYLAKLFGISTKSLVRQWAILTKH